MSARRVLLAITIYNGRDFVPRCLDSAAHVRDSSTNEVDVVLFDDASPEPGFSIDCAAWAADRGIGHYRTPRNLGIPRNFNLCLLYAADAGYDHVLISNSDVVYSATSIDELVAAAESDDTIGSVTAWSTNVSIFSIPNLDPDAHLADQSVVDLVGETLSREFHGTTVDLPTGVGFALLVPTRHLPRLGLFDPVYGRGYCEEVDWCRRSQQSGFRTVLAPGSFIYHEGGVSNTEAGLLQKGHTTVMANEAILDLRFPTYRAEVEAFDESDVVELLSERATGALVADVARTGGWVLEVGWFASEFARPGEVHCLVDPDGPAPRATLTVHGFQHHVQLPGDAPGQLVDLLGGPPRAARLREHGSTAAAFVAAGLAQDSDAACSYPSRVFDVGDVTRPEPRAASLR